MHCKTSEKVQADFLWYVNVLSTMCDPLYKGWLNRHLWYREIINTCTPIWLTSLINVIKSSLVDIYDNRHLLDEIYCNKKIQTIRLVIFRSNERSSDLALFHGPSTDPFFPNIFRWYIYGHLCRYIFIRWDTIFHDLAEQLLLERGYDQVEVTYFVPPLSKCLWIFSFIIE